MKKCFILILSMLLFIGMLSSCSDEKPNNTNEKTTVTIWHNWNVEEGEGEHELKVIVDKFNDSQNDIVVVLESQPSSGFTDKVYTSVANGVGPDIFFSFANTVPEFAAEGLVANMDEYIDTDALKQRENAALWDEAWGFSDGHMHIVPIQVTLPVLFYNKTLYDEYGLSAPRSWDELKTNSIELVNKSGIVGFAADSLIDLGQAFIAQTGAKYIDTTTHSVGFNTKECKDIFEWYSTAVKDGYFANSFSTGNIEGDFNAGLLASFMGTSSYEPYIAPNGFEYEVAEIPGLNDNYWIPIFNRGAVVLSSTPEREAAACKFVEFFVNEENSANWCKSIGALSPYSDTSSLDSFLDYIKDDKVLSVASKSVQNAGTTPAVIGAVTVRNEIKQMLSQMIGDVVSTDEAFATAETNCNQALAGN